MADITQKDFQALLKAQQQTTEMLRLSMLTAEERDAERAAAEARRVAMAEAARKGWETRRLNAENEGNDAQEATVQAIETLTDQQKSIADEERGNRAKADEKSTEAQLAANKNQSILSRIAGGITTLKDNAINTAKKAGKTGLQILSGIAFGALLYAFGEFLQSDTFKNLTNYLTGPDGLIERVKNFDISFGEGAALLGVLLGGVALAFSASGLSLLFKPINLAVKGITAGLGSLGTRLGGVATRLGGGGGGGKDKLVGGAGRDKLVGGARVKGGGVLGKVGSSIASVGRGAGAGLGALLKGMAGGLAAIANPLTLAGLAAVTVAINGIAFAIEMASPAFEPFGKLLESAGKTIKTVFEGLGSTIESIGASVSGIIGSIADGITNILQKISDARTAGVKAKTEQIQQLSAIDPGTIETTARGITLMKNALEGFGSESFGNVIKGLISDGPVGEILKLAEKHEILNKAARAVMAITASGMSYQQIMDEEKRQSRMAELEEKTAGGTKTVLGIGYTAKDLAEDQEELAKLRGQTKASVQGMFTADPRVEAMITSAINKSKLATAPVVNNVITNNTDARNQSQNTQQQVGAPLTNAKYPRLAYGESRSY